MLFTHEDSRREYSSGLAGAGSRLLKLRQSNNGVGSEKLKFPVTRFVLVVRHGVS